MIARPLLHRLFLERDEADMVMTRAELLRDATFIDGRTDFSCGPPKRVPLRQFIADEAAPAPVSRMIFHVGFCGSTLLAHLLDVSGRSLVLREPNCLADLANQRAAASPEAFNEVLAAAIRHLARPWTPKEIVVVKASNWVNVLLPSLIDKSVRPLFLTSSRRHFITAVLRGGPERVAFTARAAVHLSTGDAEAALLVAAAIGADNDKAGQLTRLAATAHEIQIRQFRAAAGKGGWPVAHWLDQSELAAAPIKALGNAAAALNLSLPPESLAANVTAWAGRHAKQPSDAFSRLLEESAVAAVEEQYGADLDRALAWASRTFDG